MTSVVDSIIDPSISDSEIYFAHPNDQSKIYKDECALCFSTPIHPDGLFVCLRRFYGLCIDHIDRYQSVVQQKAFLWIKRTQTEEIEEAENDQKENTLVTTEYAFVLYPDLNVKIPITQLNEKLVAVCQIIINKPTTNRLDQLGSEISQWDGEPKCVSKHSENLLQLENAKKVPVSGWKCEADGCTLTENLWLNLTDGVIKCGRSQFIQEGILSMGNNHMEVHYNTTKYPLVVKLGTISKDHADVYSYDENDSVMDRNLRKHLAHFGIDMDECTKTEKSTYELECDMNEKWEWSMCLEDGKMLENVYGPGFTGMINIGSSCYINAMMVEPQPPTAQSIAVLFDIYREGQCSLYGEHSLSVDPVHLYRAVQLLLQIPDFVRQYSEENEKMFFRGNDFIDGIDDFNCQMAKVVSSLISDKFSQADSKFNGIKPAVFRRVAGQGHCEFSTNRQQDVDEYLRFLIAKIDNSVSDNPNPIDSIRFKLETRVVDSSGSFIKCEENEEVILSVVVPMRCGQEGQVEMGEGEEPFRPTISWSECLTKTFDEQTISDFRSPVTCEFIQAKSRRLFASFPDFLILQLQKFYLTETWTVKKMNVNVDMPEIMDLEFLRRKDVPSDVLVVDHGKSICSEVKNVPRLEEEYVNALCSMGFSAEASRRAVYVTKSVGLNEASNWLMNHLEDADINIEHPDLHTTTEPEPSMVAELQTLGFSGYQASYALKQCKNNINNAAEWLLLHADTVPLPAEIKENSPNVAVYSDGCASYQLIGFISHMGANPNSGHYVCHLKKEDKWYLFNDEKVAVSQKPPTQLGYVYLYKRIDSV